MARVSTSGLFVVFEGGEGSGKSTQTQRLATSLRDAGRDVITTREPGGVPSAEAIRELVLDPGTPDLDPRAEALLFAAARAEHVSELIAPSLARGAIVICDRFIDSSVAYQGVARRLGHDWITQVSMWATRGTRADLTIVLDVDPELGLERAGRTGAAPDRMESQPSHFHEVVRQAFLDQAAANPNAYLVLDATSDSDALAEAISDAVSQLLQ